jgi:hypothetical protein
VDPLVLHRQPGTAADLPEAVKDFAALVDTDEIIGILADNALAELKPAIGDLFKGIKR